MLTDIVRAFESGDFARPNLFEVEIRTWAKTLN
ncbi:tail tube monomer [Klebsiella phage CPRSA]|nr:tail tube monomer [Klebsiella phage CPRSA]